MLTHVQNTQEISLDAEGKVWYNSVKVVETCGIFLFLQLNMEWEAWF